MHAAGIGGVPASGAAAVVVSVTTSASTAAGVLKVNPGTTPAAGTINYQAGDLANEQFIAPLDAAGDLTIRASTPSSPRQASPTATQEATRSTLMTRRACVARSGTEGAPADHWCRIRSAMPLAEQGGG